MKNLLLLSLCLILSISSFGKNRSIVTALTAWGVEQQSLADRVAINYMAIATGFDRFDRIQAEMKADVLSVKENQIAEHITELPVSLRPAVSKVEMVVSTILELVDTKPGTDKFHQFVALNMALQNQILELKEALRQYSETVLPETVNQQALELAAVFNAQVQLSHKAVISYLATISNENNSAAKSATLTAIIDFESSLHELMELSEADDSYEQYISTELSNWRIIERYLTNSKMPTKDQMFAMLGVLNEMNDNTLNHVKNYLQQTDDAFATN